jgi:hypothetical protein
VPRLRTRISRPDVTPLWCFGTHCRTYAPTLHRLRRLASKAVEHFAFFLVPPLRPQAHAHHLPPWLGASDPDLHQPTSGRLPDERQQRPPGRICVHRSEGRCARATCTWRTTACTSGRVPFSKRMSTHVVASEHAYSVGRKFVSGASRWPFQADRRCLRTGTSEFPER